MKKNKTAAMPSMDHDWRAESDLRTLTEANQIRSDRDRLARAQDKAREQVKALSQVGGKDTRPPAPKAPARRASSRDSGIIDV